jgi:glycine/D-amino acid oxidase-like deaminating enzyme/nitrite reductase/ring-hydroxylating ferredoxin subunit
MRRSPCRRRSRGTSARRCASSAAASRGRRSRTCSRAGRDVVLLDDDPLLAGETARTTAHLVTALDAGWSRLVWVHGERIARLAAASHAAAIERIAAIVADERIACHFARVDGWLFAAPGTPDERLDDELRAAHQAGLLAVRRTERAPLPHFDTGPALRFPRQAQLHPLRYLDGLWAAARRHGVRAYGHTRATAIAGARPARVTTTAGPAVVAERVVVATNTPVVSAPTLHAKQAPYRTYVVTARVPRGAVPPALYWDTAEPFHYLRTQPAGEHDLVIVGGEDHKTGQDDGAPAARWERLAAWARARIPEVGAIEHRWSGQVMESMDGLAFIGRSTAEPEVWIATGDSGNGMTHGTIAGILLGDLLAGRPNPWSEVYDPGRVRLRAVGEFARENLNVATQYTAWVERGDAEPEPRAGRGAVRRRGLALVAVYRDAAGRVHERSAVCPHLGCIVTWNTAESTWDCPCHGSRFDPLGRVVHGPANRDLAPVDDRAADEAATPPPP